MEMGKEEREEHYPLKMLHTFLLELDMEWERFRMASLIGIIISVALLILLAPRLIVVILRVRNIGLFQVLGDLAFLIMVCALILYEISLLFREYKFFKKWERRMGLLLHLEEKLLEGHKVSSGSRPSTPGKGEEGEPKP